MSARSIYKRLKNSAILDDSIISELFQDDDPHHDTRIINSLFKIAMNSRDWRITNYLMSSNKIHMIFSQAIARKDEKILNFLLSHCTNLGPWTVDGKTAIHHAIYNDYTSIINQLFSRYKDDNHNYTDVNGLSHFHAACASGNITIARRFLDLGIDPQLCFRYELSGDNMYSALHLAVKYLQVDIVVMILNHSNVLVNLQDNFKVTPLHLACYRVECYSQDCQSIDRHRRQLDIIELLLRHGSDVNARDSYGNSPLLAIFQDNLHSTRCAKSTDIAIDTINYHDESELQKSKIALLLKYNVDVGVVNEKTDNVLHLLIKQMENTRRPKALVKVSFDDVIYVDMVKLLVKAGVNVNVINDTGDTPMQLAVNMLSLNMVELLLNHDANVSQIRMDENEFCYSEDVIPSLEATENLLGIVDELSSRGLILDKQSNMAVLKFLTGNHINYRYDVWTDRNASYKVKNLLELGTDENIIQAFAKIPLDIYDTSFKAQFMKKQMVQQLYEHVTILEKGGFYISNRLRKSLRAKISSLEKYIFKVLGSSKKLSDVEFLEIESEFKTMRVTMLNENTSLHDVLSMNPSEIYYYVKNYALKGSRLKSEMEYFRCNGIMKGHFAKSLVRKFISNTTTDYFRCLINLPLPDLCCEKIFYYLDNESLINVCHASIDLDWEEQFKSEDFNSSNI